MNSLNESRLDTDKIWYLGNNRSKNFKVVQPSWSRPFFLTSSKDYAEGYNDYGIYAVTLKDAVVSEILDFDSDADVSKLGWPDIVVKKIRQGQNDLNSIAEGIYKIKYDPDGTYAQALANPNVNAKFVKAVQNTVDVADFFEDEISRRPFTRVQQTWSKYPEYRYLIQMWYDIKAAGFEGFMHTEFGSPIIALFSIDCLDKISSRRIDL